MLLASHIVLWFLVGFLLILAVGVLGEVKRLRASGLSDPRLPAGSRVPEFSAIDLRSDSPISSKMLDARDYVLLFVSSRCTACHALLSKIRGVDQDQMVVVCRGGHTECKDFLTMLEPATPLLFDAEGSVAEQLGVAGVPMVVMLKRGRIDAYGQPRTLKDFRKWREERLDGRTHGNVMDHGSQHTIERYAHSVRHEAKL